MQLNMLEAMNIYVNVVEQGSFIRAAEAVHTLGNQINLAIGRTKYNLNIRVSVLKISKSRNDDCPGERNRDVKAQAAFRRLRAGK